MHTHTHAHTHTHTHTSHDITHTLHIHKHGHADTYTGTHTCIGTRFVERKGKGKTAQVERFTLYL